MFFPALSIFSGARTIQSLKNLAALIDSDCLLCGALHAGEICRDCDASLERAPDGPPRRALRARSFESTIAVFAYRFPLERLVHRFKYAGDLAVGHWLASRLAERVRTEQRPDVLVVPPATRARLHERGFNPA